MQQCRRYYIVLPDVDELRKLVPDLMHSDELVASAYRYLGPPRWE